MPATRRPRTISVCAALAAALTWRATRAEDEFLLIDRHLDVHRTVVVELTPEDVRHMLRPGPGLPASATRAVLLPLEQCVAIVNAQTADDRSRSRTAGEVVLANGQRIPGERVSGVPAAADTLVWDHAQFGRLEIPLDGIASIAFTREASHPVASDADVVVLANGDRLTGFIVAIGDPIELETTVEGEREVLSIPVDRAVAIAMVTPAREASGQRVWLRDGTVMDVRHVEASDDGSARLVDPVMAGSSRTERIAMSHLAAVLFDPGAFVPLASLRPSSVEGPPTRYRTPGPEIESGERPLGLAEVRLSGPVVVRYALPARPMRFAAEASLPPTARTWGDCEIVIRDDDSVLFRATLDGASPRVMINAPLRGSELAIELTEGAGGPIQDQVVLTRAMLLGE